MKSLEMSGKTVDEAVEKALTELNVTKDKVEIKVIDEGSKGIFGIFKTKDAKVQVTIKEDYKEDAKKFLRDVLNSMKILAEIKIKEEDDILKINLIGPNMGLVIGYRGETLDSLQYLVSLVVNKNNNEKYRKVSLDTENYRIRREETLKRLAEKLAYKVRKTNKVVKLEPMNPYERRIIHSTLQNNSYVVTYSEGEEPHRRVIIDLRKKA
ncbi:RNA-binding cell elongation regulator Jag/EloR [Clostridium botulinum]|uniref:RNA-binding protein KhpB n=1 Tax=Clostridium botulinum TaxID=1491 RepID=A0A9Q1UY62_CLOBO|nr:RNA-binding cell elongation regulator Jag/EloR [Clostridium botulinum]AEB74688.1 jag protein [Clostridium botulinum BKT015925]KEI01703.1 DNA-binding protein [Clostridium botulinum C/D str. Sp77]KEI02722.1 DNA-binding protein [Clostridium botulinum D str. 16868]KLU74915.1 DNA-binding protein [Clostridium botulinum V891]KOA77084.1 DNA-binding protein [Clostridium botulinum]